MSVSLYFLFYKFEVIFEFRIRYLHMIYKAQSKLIILFYVHFIQFVTVLKSLSVALMSILQLSLYIGNTYLMNGPIQNKVTPIYGNNNICSLY